ncbi:HAD-IA family hydrolase [Phycicoccus sonneratiae]|uniref:HAD-IA family hydrolase n=1 Tax=Phycicoccus sonneratiae TaxID=2807628 RepID=A0ABS2CHX7_9MICO|nr:HAD-IA family hydrolase [Phycicoccus sonneraticus]MBM6399405.1 HAD-IA family hydrolase [Phycicoccus sonneraticus]
MTGLRALLWDADGVLQHTPPGWLEELEAAGGPGFADEVFAAELPALRGDGRLRERLAEVLAGRPGTTIGIEELLGFWERALPDEAALALVGEVRDAGVRCALATNQHDHRRAWMRDALGLDRRFDDAFYSCELGVAKPEPAYFEHVLDVLGAAPGDVGFVDDSPANVDAARALGLRAVRHDPASGAPALRALVGSLIGRPL